MIHGDFKSYIDYLNSKMVDKECRVIFNMVPTPNGQIAEIGSDAKFLWGFEDGILVRTDQGECVLRWDRFQKLQFVSGIHTPPNHLSV